MACGAEAVSWQLPQPTTRRWTAAGSGQGGSRKPAARHLQAWRRLVSLAAWLIHVTGTDGWLRKSIFKTRLQHLPCSQIIMVVSTWCSTFLLSQTSSLFAIGIDRLLVRVQILAPQPRFTGSCNVFRHFCGADSSAPESAWGGLTKTDFVAPRSTNAVGFLVTGLKFKLLLTMSGMDCLANFHPGNEHCQHSQ